MQSFKLQTEGLILRVCSTLTYAQIKLHEDRWYCRITTGTPTAVSTNDVSPQLCLLQPMQAPQLTIDADADKALTNCCPRYLSLRQFLA